MGIEALAAAVVGQFLVPLLSKGAEAISDKLGSALGEATGNEVTSVAGKVLARVRRAFGAEDETALDQLKRHPQHAAPLVQSVLEEKLREDPDLAAELESLVERRPPGSTSSVGTIMAEYAGTVQIGAHSQIRAPVTGLVVNQPRPE